MSTVEHLTPGDVVEMGGTLGSAVFLARGPHPIWPSLQLVIWKLDDGTWSFDALHLYQEIGQIVTVHDKERDNNLRWILLGQRHERT